jgi:PAS domain S-box-containing protein
MPLTAVPGADVSGNLLLSLAGLAATALLGALLLTITGHARRTERAVTHSTAELRREISERAQFQQALADSEARLRSILDHLPLGVMFLDTFGRVIDTNPHLCGLLGRQAQDLQGLLLTDMVHSEELADVQQQRRALLRGQATVVQRQLRVLTGDGSWLPVKVSATALRDPQGRVQRMVAVVEDISEHLRLEASERALQRADAANRAKSEFVSRMSHELRTPLNAMIGFAQLLGLDREPGLAPHQRDWTQHIQRAGWHLLEMINETLDLARIEAGAVHLVLQPVEVAPLVAACRSMVSAGAAERRVRLTEELSADAVAMLGDPMRLKQILTNLMSNAVKYNREGGSVTVSARRDGPDHVLVSVQDTGLGMSATQMDSLFQPYNRLGRESSGIEGTGIGLVISRRLAELMGGTLNARSAAGEGSTFTLRLPAAAPSASAPGEDVAKEPPPYQLRRVHYVEDNETNVEVMRGVLAQRPQVRLQVSTMGLDGLSAIRQERPDLILLDMQLPDISGLELLRHLKSDPEVADIPVIVVSADATPGRMQEALTLGALHYVTKPVELARFLNLLDEVLDGMETRWGL